MAKEKRMSLEKKKNHRKIKFSHVVSSAGVSRPGEWKGQMSALKNQCAPEDPDCLRHSSLLSMEWSCLLAFSKSPMDPVGQYSVSNTITHTQTTKQYAKLYKLRPEHKVTKLLINSGNVPTTCKGSKEGLEQTEMRQQTRKFQRSWQQVPARDGSQYRTEMGIKIYGSVKYVS